MTQEIGGSTLHCRHLRYGQGWIDGCLGNLDGQKLVPSRFNADRRLPIPVALSLGGYCGFYERGQLYRQG